MRGESSMWPGVALQKHKLIIIHIVNFVTMMMAMTAF